MSGFAVLLTIAFIVCGDTGGWAFACAYSCYDYAIHWGEESI